jgi:hypothetical protein
MRGVVLIVGLLLAACIGPREACLRAAGAELARLDRLIAEGEAALARGYRLERRAETATVLEFCIGMGHRGDGLDAGLRYCPEAETRVTEVPVAVDPAAERRKLAALRARREAEAPRARAAAAACPAG